MLLPQNISRYRSSILYKIAIILFLGICLIFLYRLSVSLLSDKLVDPKRISGDDFSQYWATGRLNLMGGNPYNHDQVFRLRNEAAQGYLKTTEILVMWYPPWSLAIGMPFGSLSYPSSRILWYIIHVIVIILCADQIWLIYSGPHRYRWLSLILAFTFLPILRTLYLGQITPFLLLGVVGYLRYSQRKHSTWLAGAFVALLMIKPHILYLVLLAWILWSVNRKRWIEILGFVLTILITMVIVMLINPQVISQYLLAVTNHRPDEYITPTLGAILRLAFGLDKFWLQFIPPITGLIWLLVYWQKYKTAWDWKEQMPFIVLLSLFTSAFLWSYDLVILTIAIVPTFIGIIQHRLRMPSLLLIALYLAIDALYLLFPTILFPERVYDYWYVWMAPSLLLWYLFCRVRLGISNELKTLRTEL